MTEANQLENANSDIDANMVNSVEFSEYDDSENIQDCSDLDDYIEPGDIIDDAQWDTDIEDAYGNYYMKLFFYDFLIGNIPKSSCSIVSLKLFIKKLQSLLYVKVLSYINY